VASCQQYRFAQPRQQGETARQRTGRPIEVVPLAQHSSEHHLGESRSRHRRLAPPGEEIDPSTTGVGSLGELTSPDLERG
jgi:hypothetical protein